MPRHPSAPWQIADVVSIVIFGVLAVIYSFTGRGLTADAAVFAILAVQAGRLYPRGPTPPSSPASPTETPLAPASRRRAPSALYTIALALASLPRRAASALFPPSAGGQVTT